MSKPDLKLVNSSKKRPYQASVEAARKHIKAIDTLLDFGNISSAKERLSQIDNLLKDIAEGR